MNARWVRVGTVALVCILAATGSSAATPDSAIAAGGVTDDIRDARAALGLDPSSAPGAIDTAPMVDGVPVTDGEAEWLEARSVALDDAIDAIWQVATPGELGGLWFDARTSTLHALVVQDDSASRLATVQAAEPVTISIDSVRQSIGELESIQDEIRANLDWFERQGLTLAGFGVEVRANEVTIDLVDPTPNAQELVSGRFGAAVAVQAGQRPVTVACTSRWTCDEPARGGWEIHRPFSGGGYERCTSSFMVKDVVHGTGPYLATGGHCGGGTWQHDGANWGSTASPTQYFNGSWADVQFIARNATTTTPRNLLLKRLTEPAVAMTGRAADSAQVQGVTVCASGAVSNYRCNQISLTNRDIFVSNCSGCTVVHLYHQWKAAFASTGGDSGGPVYFDSTHKWAGLTVAADGSSSWYSTQDGIYTQTNGYRPCISSSC
jgi:hypothetical protein